MCARSEAESSLAVEFAVLEMKNRSFAVTSKLPPDDSILSRLEFGAWSDIPFVLKYNWRLPSQYSAGHVQSRGSCDEVYGISFSRIHHGPGHVLVRWLLCVRMVLPPCSCILIKPYY